MSRLDALDRDGTGGKQHSFTTAEWEPLVSTYAYGSGREAQSGPPQAVNANWRSLDRIGLESCSRTARQRRISLSSSSGGYFEP